MELTLIDFSIFWDRLVGACNDQVTALLLTSFSPVVREAGDLASGLFDSQGRMICQPLTGTPGHINPLSVGVKNMLAEIPAESLGPGDVLITNDPWLTTGQLLDVTVLVPVFGSVGLVAFFAATCHMVDIGGYGPGAGAGDTFEEGVNIPPMHLRRAGKIDGTLARLLRANIRDPEHFMGDLESMVASCNVGGRKLLGLLDEYGLEGLDSIGDEILRRSREAQEEALRHLPDGTYRGETTIDGFDEPITLRCAVTIKQGRAVVDFAGSSAESPRGINVVLNYTAGYTTYAIRSITAPEVPNNDGSMAPIEVRAPEGCVLNAQRPAPTTGRHLVGQCVAEPVLNAMREVLPEGVLAEGAGSIWTLEVRGRDGRQPYSLFVTIAGGMGARPVKDGLSTVSFPASIAGVPVEVWEATIPVFIHRRQLRTDSGGPGTWRGGLGQIVEASVPGAKRWIGNLMTDRIVNPARGAAGGHDGAGGYIAVSGHDEVPGKGRLVLGSDAVVRLETPGGGGFGPPAGRDPALVARDVRDGLVSHDRAESVYGVRVREDGTFERT